MVFLFWHGRIADLMQIKVAEIADKKRWNGYLSLKENNIPLNYFQWSKIISQSYRNQTPLYLYAETELGEILGVFSGFIIKSPLGKKRLHSTRFGLIADNQNIAELFVSYINEYCKKNGVISAVLTTGFHRYDLKCREIVKYTLIMELENSFDWLWGSLRAKTRNAIRKGYKSKLRLENDSKYLLDFYSIYKKRMISKNANILSKKYFENLFYGFEENVKLFTVWKEGEMLGGLVLIHTNNSAQYIYAGTSLLADKYNTMHYLLWETIKWLYEHKIKFFDMSESTKHNGVYKFKALFGGVESSIYYYDLFKYGEKGQENKGIGKEKGLDLPLFLRKFYIEFMTRFSRII